MRLGVVFGAVVALTSAAPVAGSAVPPSAAATAASVNAVPATPQLAQTAYVKASNTDSIDTFGWSVAIDGDTMVVGAPSEDGSGIGVNPVSNNSALNAGAAYVFQRSGGVWAQTAYLKASNTDGNDRFGEAVAIDGDTIVVGAPEEQSNGSSQADDSADNAGAIYVFVRSAGVWAQQAYLKANDIDVDDKFGGAVAIDGDTIVAGARNDDGAAEDVAQAGAAYVYFRTGTTWGSQATLRASVPDVFDEFGISVGISGDTIVVGMPRDDSNATTINGDQSNNSATDAGAAHVFQRSGAAWTPQAYLKPTNTGAGDQFGATVGISGDSVIVGAQFEDGGSKGVDGDGSSNTVTDSGAAYVFHRVTGTWSQQAYIKSSNSQNNDRVGTAVAISGDRAIVGAFGEDANTTGVNVYGNNNNLADPGAAYVFRRASGTWSQTEYVKSSSSDSNDQFGFSVAADADEFLVGARFESSNAVGVNGDHDNDSAANAGAAYAYGSPCASAPFSDVGTGHTFCAEIEWMKQARISTGFGDGTYKPGDAVTRQAMSAFLARLKAASLTNCVSPPFPDVPTSHPFCKEIEWMKDNGISTGFGDGTYKPGDNVTRQAMSAFLARMRLNQAGLPLCVSPPFPDVPTSHPFCKEIKWMKDNGISTGFGDGLYHPDDDVTRQAMSAFLYRVVPLI